MPPLDFRTALAALLPCTQASSSGGSSLAAQTAEQVRPATPAGPSVAMIETVVVKLAKAARNCAVETALDGAFAATAVGRAGSETCDIRRIPDLRGGPPRPLLHVGLPRCRSAATLSIHGYKFHSVWLCGRPRPSAPARARCAAARAEPHARRQSARRHAAGAEQDSRPVARLIRRSAVRARIT